MQCKKIAFVNSKGGCGKTTSIFHVSGVLANKGEKTLVIDFDKQKNTTDTLLTFNENKPTLSILDFMRGKTNIESIVRKAYFKNRENAAPKYYGVDVLPADIRLDDVSLLKKIDIKDKLNDFVNKNGYKWLLVDMPPSNKPINEICFSQIVDFVIVPFTCDLFSFKGYTNIMDTADEARQYNPSLNIIGIYLSRYNNNCLGDQYIKDNLQKFVGDIFIDIQIPDKTDIRDSILFGRPISYYKIFSPSRTAYENLTAFMEERITQLRKGI